MESLHWADWLIFALFLGVSLSIGVYHACTGGRQKTTQEFIMADRKLQILPTVLSMVMSYKSAIMLLGMSAELYAYGSQLLLFALVVGYPVTIFICERLVVPWIYPLRLTSVFAYLEMRFRSKAARILGASFGVLSGLFYIGPAIFAPSIALEAATGFPMVLSIPIMAAVATVYTSMGGMRAVIWTDVFQGLVMLAGMLAVVIKGAYILGGLDDVIEGVKDSGRLQGLIWSPDPRIRHSFWTMSFGWFIGYSFVYGIHQSSVQRYSATRTLREARTVMLLNFPAAIFLVCVSGLMACVITAYFNHIQCDPMTNNDITSTNQILPYYVKQIFQNNKGFAGLFLATLYSGALSSVSSSLSSCAANAWEDILKCKLQHFTDSQAAAVNKILVVAFGAIGAGIAYLAAAMPGPVSQVTGIFWGAIGGPLTGMFLLGGLFRKAEWRGTVLGATIAFLFNTWMGMAGTTVKGQENELPPLSTDGCPLNSTLTELWAMNSTRNVVENEELSLSGIENLYAVSYQCYSAIGCVITILIALPTSCCLRRYFPEEEVEEFDTPEEYFLNWRSIFTFSQLPERPSQKAKNCSFNLNGDIVRETVPTKSSMNETQLSQNGQVKTKGQIECNGTTIESSGPIIENGSIVQNGHIESNGQLPISIVGDSNTGI